ncbi:MAG TPA: GAF domain-containing protein [Candidatus Stackebrandtia excrementipullorum]|nr:GAF domain-containing protein [Candidatus Stackebrandtia excrementipullorum]
MTAGAQHRVVADSDLDPLCHMVRRFLDTDAVVIALWGEEDDTVSVGAVGVGHAEAGGLATRFHPDQAASSAASPAVTDPITVDRPSTRSLIGRIGFASLVRSPLTLRGRAEGLLFVLSRTDPGEDGHDLRLVHALVRSCESALEFGRDTASATTLPEVDSLALRASSFPTLIPAIRNVVSEAVGAVSVGLSIQDEESGLLLTADGSFGLPREVTSRYFIDPNDLHSNAARVYETLRPFVSNHVIGDPAVLQSYPIAFGIESMIALPLSVSGRPIGVLMVANKPGGFAAGDVDRATTLTPRIAIAVELAKLGEAGRFELVADHVLSDLGIATVDPILDVNRFEPILRSLARIVQADHLAIFHSSDTLIEIGPVAEAPQFTVEKHCGVFQGRPLTLRVTREFGRTFSRGERRLVHEAARLLAEGLARTTAVRQETELAQHRERQRIADDLHDDVSQLLFSAQMTLDAYTAEEGPAGDAARKASDLVGRAEAALRDAIFVLNESQRSLSDALGEVVAELEANWDMDITLHQDLAADPLVPADIGTVLTRAARETLVNVAKHAHVHRAEVTTRLSPDHGHIELRVVDDGVGTGADTSTTGGHGLRSLSRRVAEFGGRATVQGRAGAGTTVTVTVPLPTPHDRLSVSAVETSTPDHDN